MREVVRAIAAIPLDDGLELDPESASAESIRDDNEYAGVRVTLTGTLSVARLTFHIDINVGDPVWPAPRPVELPRILGGTIEITGYPLTMVLAEKIVTMMQRGTANTLTRQHALNGDELHESMTTVANHRQAELVPLEQALVGFPSLAQPKWAAWRRRQRLDDRVPESFSELLTAVGAFADPAITGQTENKSWLPEALTWERRH